MKQVVAGGEMPGGRWWKVLRIVEQWYVYIYTYIYVIYWNITNRSVHWKVFIALTFWGWHCQGKCCMDVLDWMADIPGNVSNFEKLATLDSSCMCGGFRMAEWCDMCTLFACVTLLCSEISEQGHVEVIAAIAVESGKRIWIEIREDLVVHSTSYACVLVPELKDGMTHQICGLLFADWAQVLLDRNHLFEAIVVQFALEISALRSSIMRSLQKQRDICNISYIMIVMTCRMSRQYDIRHHFHSGSFGSIVFI